ncbi:MAG: acyltransferase [Muribaculaceae bacterium]|nr:acyltransferase [Muribaculaceae bacterium]
MSALSFKEFISDNFRRPRKDKLPATSKPRIEFIDLAKGVCILLVVLMHAGYTNDLPALKAMRMPLYFILSGLFFKDYGSFLNFLYKKINKILIPFCFFAIVGIILCRVFYVSASIPGIILTPFYAPTIANYPIWFLICLFWVNLLYCVISITITNAFVRGFMVFIVGLVGYFLNVHDVYIPLFIASVCSALPFFYIGTLLRKVPIFYDSHKDIRNMAMGVTLIGIVIIYCLFYGTPYIQFRVNHYHGNAIASYIVSLSMVFGLFLVCKYIVWLPIVSYLGRYSIIVLCLHAIFLEYGSKFFSCSALELLLLTLFLCWISIPLCRHFIPFFTAQTDLIKMPKRYSKDQRSVSLEASK